MVLGSESQAKSATCTRHPASCPSWMDITDIGVPVRREERVHVGQARCDLACPSSKKCPPALRGASDHRATGESLASGCRIRPTR